MEFVPRLLNYQKYCRKYDQSLSVTFFPTLKGGQSGTLFTVIIYISLLNTFQSSHHYDAPNSIWIFRKSFVLRGISTVKITTTTAATNPINNICQCQLVNSRYTKISDVTIGAEAQNWGNSIFLNFFFFTWNRENRGKHK